MDAVGTDQNVATHGFRMRAGPIEEISRDAAFVLAERPQPAAGVNHIRSQPRFDRRVNYALQPAAMNRELRHVMAGVDAAGFLPDFLAVAVEIIQHVGSNGDVIELLQQTEPGEFADRMREGIDADAEFA